MSIVDLTSDAHEWLEASVAGAERPVRMYPLHVDLHRGTRSVLVEYPDGWRRDAEGTQPAGEEFVPLSGAFTLSGHRVVPGSVLVMTPRALRSATASEGVVRAVVFFSGPGGGWESGDASATGSVETCEVTEGLVRAGVEGLVGYLEVVPEVPEDGFGADAEIVWLDELRYAFVPRGGLPPQVEGRALVRFLP